MVKPSEVGVEGCPAIAISYGGSASCRIFAKIDGRRPKAWTATARSRTNVPLSTTIATRWRPTRTSLARTERSMAPSEVPITVWPSKVLGMSANPDTIVLVHGFWVTPRSWENWITHYEAKGYRVIAPGYPGFEVEVEELRENPQIIADVTVPAVITKIEKELAELDRPPIIIGHSAGGAFTQILLDRGHGAAGVALNSAPTEGVRVVPLSQLKSTFPVLKSPANRHKAVGLSYEQWRHAVTNTFPRDEARGAYQP